MMANGEWLDLKRACPLLAVVLIGALFGNSTVLANNDSSDNETRITAAFVYNFCRFAEWPTPPGDTIRLTVFGGEDQMAAFNTISGKKVGNAVLNVLNEPSAMAVVESHALFIANSEKDAIPDILAQVTTQPVLTMSNSEGFCEQGGMIEIIKIKGKLKFVVNLKAARKVDLTISSRLLKMAIHVMQED